MATKAETTREDTKQQKIVDFIEDWFFNSNPQELVSGSYRREQYLDGYLDKVNSTNFYNKKTNISVIYFDKGVSSKPSV